MNWRALEDNLCPKCEEELESTEEGYECSDEDCGFKISEGKFEALLEKFQTDDEENY